LRKKIPLEDKTLLRKVFSFPFLFVSILWLIKFNEEYFHTDLFFLGIRPRTVEGLSASSHVLSFTPTTTIFSSTHCRSCSRHGPDYFYRGMALSVITMIWFFTMHGCGLLQADVHIGASGLIYGFVCFLFFSGVFAGPRCCHLDACYISLWKPRVGYSAGETDYFVESHFFGSVAGILQRFITAKKDLSEK